MPIIQGIFQHVKQAFYVFLLFFIFAVVLAFASPSLLIPSNPLFLILTIIILEVSLVTIGAIYNWRTGRGLLSGLKYYSILAFLASLFLVLILIPIFSTSITPGSITGVTIIALLIIPAILLLELLGAIAMWITGLGGQKEQ